VAEMTKRIRTSKKKSVRSTRRLKSRGIKKSAIPKVIEIEGPPEEPQDIAVQITEESVIFRDLTIPKEIIKMLQLRLGYSIYIKGNAGTGKTSLALTILTLPIVKNPLFITTRITPNSLFAQFPWITLFDISFLDYTHYYQASLHLQGFGVDKRVRKFVDISSFMTTIYEEYKNRKDKDNPLVVVIDSYEAFVQFYNETKDKVKPQLVSPEHLLTEFCRNMGIKMIFISEQPDAYSELDYLVDAVINLSIEQENERIFRTLHFLKTRGIEIESPKYSYTLINGKFHYFKPFHDFQLPEIIIEPEIISDPMKNRISTGIKSFDEFSKGFRIGSFNVLEYSRISGENWKYLIIPFIYNHLKQNRGIFIVMPDALTAHTIVEILLKIDSTIPIENLKIFTRIENSNSHSGNQKHIFKNIPNSLKEFFQELNNVISKLQNQIKANEVSTQLHEISPIIIGIISFEFMNFLLSSKDFIQYLNTFIANIYLKGVTLLSLIQKEHKQKNEIVSMAATHWNLYIHNNTLFFNGIKPFTNAFGITIDRTMGFIDVKMIPIK